MNRELTRSVLYSDKVVSHKHKFVAVLTPKVARTTLLEVMTKSHQEIFEAEEIRISTPELLASDEFASYFKFAFVRSPWARAVSCWLSKVAAPKTEGVRNILARYEGLEPGMPFDAFVNWLTTDEGSDEKADRHWASQYLFVGKGEPKIELDFVGKYESLQNDFNRVCQSLRIPPLELPVMNARQLYVDGDDDLRSDDYYLKYFDDDLITQVGHRYTTDVALFGYSKPRLW